MFDCHMHSIFSTDSTMNAAEACKTAIQQGLEGIAFTDHLDIDYPDTDESFDIEYKEYFRLINDIREEYKGRLNVLRAIEAGIQPHVLDDTLKIIESYPFDYVLASIHIIDGVDPYRRVYYSDKSKKEAYERYLGEIFFMVQNFKNFDMVGHFEYIIRYAQYADRTIRYADHTEIFDSILKELILQGRGFELNTGTYRDPAANAQYDFDVLKRYHELGGEFICLGSDAHRTEHVGLRFDYYSQMIKNAGFEYTVHFENRKPVRDRL